MCGSSLRCKRDNNTHIICLTHTRVNKKVSQYVNFLCLCFSTWNCVGVYILFTKSFCPLLSLSLSLYHAFYYSLAVCYLKFVNINVVALVFQFFFSLEFLLLFHLFVIVVAIFFLVNFPFHFKLFHFIYIFCTLQQFLQYIFTPSLSVSLTIYNCCSSLKKLN